MSVNMFAITDWCRPTSVSHSIA